MEKFEYSDLELEISYFDSVDIVTDSVDDIPVSETDMGEWFQ